MVTIVTYYCYQAEARQGAETLSCKSWTHEIMWLKLTEETNWEGEEEKKWGNTSDDGYNTSSSTSLEH